MDIAAGFGIGAATLLSAKNALDGSQNAELPELSEFESNTCVDTGKITVGKASTVDSSGESVADTS